MGRHRLIMAGRWGGGLILAGRIVTTMMLSGCVTAAPDVLLKNPETGQTFTCSGSSGSTGRWWDEMAKRTRDNCVKDLQAQGYVIVK